MKTIERYLATVRSYLPKKDRDDIVRELSEDIRARMESKEAALGGSLTEQEQKALLDELGEPLALASRYHSDKRRLAFGAELIGPVLFPCYEKVLRINLGLTLLACVVLTIILHGPQALLRSVPAIAINLLFQFALVTGIFVAAEAQSARKKRA